jgi:hypothetical protein
LAPESEMSQSPWTDLEPQPGDFDADLATLDERFVRSHRGNQNAKVRIVVSIEGEDAERLQRISVGRGARPAVVIADLLREADRSAA